MSLFGNISGCQSRGLQVFLCHASEDKAAVRELYERLREDGFRAWLDVEDLHAGVAWEIKVPDVVRESDVVLACLTSHSINKHGYVQKEIKVALDVADEKPEETVYIIPVKLEECDVPRRLAKWQWVNLFEPNGYKRLVSSLRALTPRSIGKNTAAADQPPSQLLLRDSPVLQKLGLHDLERNVRWWEASTQREIAAEMDASGEWFFYEREPHEVSWTQLAPMRDLTERADALLRARAKEGLRRSASAGQPKPKKAKRKLRP